MKSFSYKNPKFIFTEKDKSIIKFKTLSKYENKYYDVYWLNKYF
jgi:hypothetical protein